MEFRPHLFQKANHEIPPNGSITSFCMLHLAMCCFMKMHLSSLIHYGDLEGPFIFPQHRSCLINVGWMKGILKNKEQKSDEKRLDFLVRKQERKRLEEMQDKDKNNKTNYWDPLRYFYPRSGTCTWLHPSRELFLVTFIGWLLLMPKSQVLFGKQPNTIMLPLFPTPQPRLYLKLPFSCAWPITMASQLVSQLFP